MRSLITLALLAVLALPASAADKPASKAEYDALVKPLKEKSQKAKEESNDAEKRIKAVQALPKMAKVVEDYVVGRNRMDLQTKKVAEMKASDATKPKDLAAAERLRDVYQQETQKAYKDLAEKYPNEAKELEKAVGDKTAAHKVIQETAAEIAKLGPPPKK
jgi:hypothetical protein